jgi:8-oxo-dGTP diphosphatase
MPPMATPRVAAGALFFDTEDRVLLVRPTYKDHWDIPGGYVEPGESPRAACIREIQEELGLTINIGPMLVVDWAPAGNEGDKLLFVFDAGTLTEDEQRRIAFRDGELAEGRFIATDEIEPYVPARLARRIGTAANARHQQRPSYAEHGSEPT